MDSNDSAHKSHHSAGVGDAANGGMEGEAAMTAHASHKGSGREFSTELTTAPAKVRAGEPATLRFRIKDAHGEAVKDLQIVHEKAMHLLVVSHDLDEFEHLHPEQQADGSFQTPHTFPHGGDYLLYADYTPQNAAQVVDRHTLSVAGEPRERVPLVADAERSKTIDGLRFTMRADRQLRAGREVMLNYTVTDEQTGAPVTDLQPYLGAMAHFVVISEDTTDFLHVHPMEKDAHGSDGAGGHAQHDSTHQMHAGGDASKVQETESPVAKSNEIAAHTVFPRAGLYKIWAQFQRGGRVVTVPFVVSVEEDSATTESNDAASDHHVHS